jgi:hypothetical protein
MQPSGAPGRGGRSQDCRSVREVRIRGQRRSIGNPLCCAPALGRCSGHRSDSGELGRFPAHPLGAFRASKTRCGSSGSGRRGGPKAYRPTSIRSMRTLVAPALLPVALKGRGGRHT